MTDATLKSWSGVKILARLDRQITLIEKETIVRLLGWCASVELYEFSKPTKEFIIKAVLLKPCVLNMRMKDIVSRYERIWCGYPCFS